MLSMMLQYDILPVIPAILTAIASLPADVKPVSDKPDLKPISVSDKPVPPVSVNDKPDLKPVSVNDKEVPPVSDQQVSPANEVTGADVCASITTIVQELQRVCSPDSPNSLCAQFNLHLMGFSGLPKWQGVLFDEYYGKIEKLAGTLTTLPNSQFQNKLCTLLQDLSKDFDRNFAATDTSALAIVSTNEYTVRNQAWTFASTFLSSKPSHSVTALDVVQNSALFESTMSLLLNPTTSQKLMGDQATSLAEVSKGVLKKEVSAGGRVSPVFAHSMTSMILGVLGDWTPTILLPSASQWLKGESNLVEEVIGLQNLRRIYQNKVITDDVAEMVKGKYTRSEGDMLADSYVFLVKKFRSHYISVKQAAAAGYFYNDPVDESLIQEYVNLSIQYLQASFHAEIATLTKFTGIPYVAVGEAAELFGVVPADMTDQYAVPEVLFKSDPQTSMVSDFLDTAVKTRTWRLEKGDNAELRGQIMHSLGDILTGQGGFWSESFALLARTKAETTARHLSEVVADKILGDTSIVLKGSNYGWRTCKMVPHTAVSFDFKKVKLSFVKETSLAIVTPPKP